MKEICYGCAQRVPQMPCGLPSKLLKAEIAAPSYFGKQIFDLKHFGG
jgi:hypothetical protein